MKSCTEKILSFELERFEVRASGFTDLTYYNIDLTTGKTLTLADVLGPDWKEKADAVVQAAIDAHPENFFTAEMGGFTGVSEDQRFYMNSDGNPVLVFEKYEIAPGSSGELEFEVPIGDNSTAQTTPPAGKQRPFPAGGVFFSAAEWAGLTCRAVDIAVDGPAARPQWHARGRSPRSPPSPCPRALCRR